MRSSGPCRRRASVAHPREDATDERLPVAVATDVRLDTFCETLEQQVVRIRGVRCDQDAIVVPQRMIVRERLR